MRAYHWILGYADCRVRGDHAACFFNLCREKGFAYTPIQIRQKKESGQRIRRLNSDARSPVWGPYSNFAHNAALIYA
jgi:hypothetical protein